MGYEHYWKRPPSLDADAFAAWSRDIRKIVGALPDEVIRDSAGIGEPIVTDSLVSFNGNADRHSFHIEIYAAFNERFSKGFLQWLTALPPYAGVPFVVPCIVEHIPYSVWSMADGRGWLRTACKTRQKLYDVAVTAALILLAHHFPNSCRVTSDGLMADWIAGLELAERATNLPLHIPIYSHQLWYSDSLPRETFAVWSADVAKIFAITDVPLAGPDGSGHPVANINGVKFNGVGDDGYDPFHLSYLWVPNDGRGHHHGWVYWEIQTMGNAGKRYDEVVIATLILFAHHFFPDEMPEFPTPNSYQIFSKADEVAWLRGADLVERATGLRKHVSVDESNRDVTIT